MNALPYSLKEILKGQISANNWGIPSEKLLVYSEYTYITLHEIKI